MPGIITISQKKKLKKAAKDKYHVEKRRGTLATKHLWTYAFIGDIDIKELYKCYNITP